MPVLNFASRVVFTAALAPCLWLTEDNGDKNGAALGGEGGARGAGTRRGRGEKCPVKHQGRPCPKWDGNYSLHRLSSGETEARSVLWGGGKVHGSPLPLPQHPQGNVPNNSSPAVMYLPAAGQ